MAYLPCTADVQCRIDTLCKTRKQGNEPNPKGSEGSPVDTVVIVINPVILVELVDVELPLLDEVEIRDHDSGNGTHDARVAREECQETGCVLDNVSRRADYAEDRYDNRCTEDVDIFGTQACDVVTEWIGAGGDLVADGSEHEGKPDEEFGSPTVETLDH